MWHIDTTVIRLFDETPVYLNAVLDSLLATHSDVAGCRNVCTGT